MNVAHEFAEQWEGIRRSHEAGRLAHAYIIVGSPRGNAAVFTEAVLRLIYGITDADDAAARRIKHRVHPDIVWIEPQSKGRQIRVSEIRVLNQRLQQTAMEGGWKVGILTYADRMNDQASNAFLKTLEEPAGQSLILLLTEAPQVLLPTIRSRCQQIVLSGRSSQLPDEWLDKLLCLLRSSGGRDPVQVFLAAEGLKGLLDEMKKEIESSMEKSDTVEQAVYDAQVQSRLLEMRNEVMTALLQWQRDILCCVVKADRARVLHFSEEADVLHEQARGLSLSAALQRVSAVEDMARRLSRNVPPLVAFQAGFLAQLQRRESSAAAVRGRAEGRPA